MERKTKIYLRQEQETLLIPLYAKAQDNPILQDEKARQVLDGIHYDFLNLKVPQKTAIMVLMRAKQFDHYANQFITAHPNALVLHLGCGLDSRCQRVARAESLWYDLDMPDVIKLRRLFFQENDNTHMIASSVTDLSWVQSVKDNSRPVLILAEGLLMYLHESDVRSLLLYLHDAFANCLLVFDAFSSLTAERVQSHPSIQETGAQACWGIDDPHDIMEWSRGIRLEQEWFFHQSPDIEKLNWFYRFMFRISASIPSVRNAHRLLVYSL